MKLNQTLLTIAVTALSWQSQAAITVVSSDFNSNGNTNLYGTNFFTSVAVQAGDVLVLTHANNKRDNGSNTISASASSESFTALSGGDSGGQAGAWLFYTTISTSATIDISFDTSNANKNGSKANGYYLLRPGAGENIVLVDTDTIAATAGTSLGLNFDAAASGGFAVMAGAVQTDSITGTPTGWTQDQTGNNKRTLWSDEGVTNLTPAVTITATDADVAVGAVFNTVAVPEPSSTALLGLGGLALLLRRRK